MPNRFLYKELPPKQRFLKILENHIMPQLELDGFKLMKSGPSLKRIENGFEWEVIFYASKWNRGNEVCKFNPDFIVRNKDYRKLLRTNKELQYGSYSGIIGTTTGKHHWDKTIWSTDNSEAYFLDDADFAKVDNYDLADEIVENVRKVGIPYFQMMSNFDSIKNFVIAKGWSSDAPMLFDLCYVLDRTDEIDSIIEWYETTKKHPAEDLERAMEKRKKLATTTAKIKCL